MDDFIITVFSNSNTNTYNNTLTSFSNDLPKIFELKENWYVCLQSVGFSTKSDTNIFSVRNDDMSEVISGSSKYNTLIKVKCDQIQNQIFNDSFSQDLGVLKINIKPDQDYFFYEFENEQYARLANTTLNKISIYLTDKYNRPLNLHRGVSSFARLKFKRMTGDFFNVRAYSGSDNPNNFNFSLPQQLYVDSNWKVAITSMHYHKKFKPLPSEESLRTICTSYIIDNQIGVLNKFVIPNIMYNSIGELITEINKLIGKSIDCRISLLNISTLILHTPPTAPTLNSSDDLLQPIFHLKDNTALFMPTLLAEILGFDHEKNDYSENILVKENVVGLLSQIINKPNISSINNLYKDPYQNPLTYLKFMFTGKPNINALDPLYFMIYTDIITPCIVGSGYANLLKIIPVETKELDNIQEFKNKEFHSMDSTLLKNINISIRCNDGNLVNFADNARVFINLLFIRK